MRIFAGRRMPPGREPLDGGSKMPVNRDADTEAFESEEDDT
jgi:hypothetical protein